MKQTTLILLFLVLNLISYSQETSPFLYLDKIEIQNFKGRELYIQKTNAQIINKKRIELSKENIFYAEECEGEYMTLIAICRIDNSNKSYAIAYSVCPNPEFTIYDSDNPHKIYGNINADKLFITGNGSIYCSGGESTFDAKKKFNIIGDKLIEIQQPFYYIGLKTRTLRPIKLFETIDLENEIANLPMDYPVEIILSNKSFNSTKGLYLVKTKFGLTGWSELKAGQGESVDVEGLIYTGD